MTDRAWRVLLAIATVATIAPLFATRYLPFTDQPEHVAVIASLRHWFDPAWRIQEHYYLAAGRSQYLAYHLAGAALSFATGDPLRASTLLLAVVGAAYPLATRSMLLAFGRDERLALFACPLFWSRALVVGLHPFVAAVPLALYGIALAARQVEAPTRARAWGLAAFGVLLFYTHVSAFTVFLVVAVAITSVSSSDRLRSIASFRSLAARLIWLVPGVALALVWHVRGGLEQGETASVARNGALRAVPAVPIWTHDIWRGHADEAIMIAFWLCIVAVLLQEQKRSFAPKLFVPLACAVLLYLVTPYRIGPAVMLDVRLGAFVVIFALLPLAPVRSRLGAIPLLGAFAVAVATGAVATWEITRCVTEEISGFDAILAQTRDGTRLVTLNFRADSAHTFYPAYGHVGAYHRARHGGVASYSFSELPHWPLRYRPEAAPPPKSVTPWDYDPCVFRNGIDGVYYDYVLVRGPVDPFEHEPPGPQWRKSATAHDFTLYEKVAGEAWPARNMVDPGPCGATPER
jgi:hypothetical protein